MMKTLWMGLMLATTAVADPVTLSPSQDSDIYSFTSRPTSSTNTLGVNSSGAGSPHTQVSLIQFDLSGVSAAEEVGTATLRLYVLAADANFGGTSPGTVAVHTQANAWAVSSLHWGNASAADFVGLLPVATSDEDNWVEIDVTAAVRAWVAGENPNYGFLLMPEDELASPYLNVSFGSGRLTPYGFGPQLVIAPPEPSVEPPVLTIAAAEGEVVLEWPVANSEGWTLQWSQTLTEGEWQDWDSETAPITETEGRWRLRPGLSVPKAFFRLVKP